MEKLPDTEIRQLCVRAQQGSAAARERLLRAHDPLILHVAKYFYRAGNFMELGDLVQQGCLGLLHAIDKYDPKKCVRGRLVQFATYAHYWVSHSIRREIETHGRTIAVPIKRVKDARVAQYLKRFSLDSIPHVAISLDNMVGDLEDPAKDRSDVWDQQRQLDYLLRRLPGRARQILRDRYGLAENSQPMTQKQVGKKLNLSGTLVGMQERSALYRLRQFAAEMQA